ncbi:acrosomal protein KIAA1210 homolog isoform 2-T3 [Anomaloglossus baeobatrachus]
MATNTSEGTRTVEGEETHEECSGKKKSKFQAFKKLFVKKKRKEPATTSRESNLKPSQSSTDVSASGANTTAFHVDHEQVAKANMGNKAVSHDSVFISEMESSVKEDVSQECTPGKVKALQLQLQQNIRIGSPPRGIVPKKLEDPGTLSEDDGLPRSPPEITSLHEILAQSSGKSSISVQRRSSISLGGTDSEDDPESSELSSRPTSPLQSNVRLCPASPVSHFPLADFSLPLSSVSCLDNSAAKHKILVKPKKRRAPTMNVKTQDIEGTNKPAKMKKEDESCNMIEVQQPVKILDSEKCFVELDASSEVNNIEDAVLQRPKEDLIVSVSESQMDISYMNSKNSSTALLLEASLFENQILSFQNEAVCSETDVDGSRLSTENQIDESTEDSEREEFITSLQTCDSQPSHENIDDILDMVNPSEINHVDSREGNTVQIESPSVNTSQALDCDALGDYQPNLEKIEATDGSDIIDKECNEHGKVLPGLEKNVLNVIESDLDEDESLQNCVLSLEPVTSISDDEFQEVQFVPGCVGLYESNDEEPQCTITENAEIAVEVSERLVETDVGKIEPSEQEPKTFDQSITEGNNEHSEVDSVNNIKAPAIIMNANDSSYTNVSTTVPDVGLLSKSEASTEMVKGIKAAEPNPEGDVKGSTKPVRFTVAPAWQRAISSGSSVKESPFIKNMVGNIDRSESFDGADESLVQSNSKKNYVKKNKEESSGHFGVRLRRTSSSTKYSEDNQEVSSKQDLSSVDNSSLLPERSLQSPKKTQINCVKVTKIPSANEEKVPQEIKIQAKPRAEDHSPQEHSEPVWITMAKLKQKGFQEHPLAKEQSMTVEIEKAEGTECIQQKNPIPSLEEVEAERSEQTATDSPAAPEEAPPNSEKITRPTQPQHPEEPPWFSLAKKKAKAWSEMPQNVQQ